MTERKPTGVSIETWVDRQIREAAERGEFENLPGYGKPLASLDAPYDELWWIKGKLHREGFSPLPPRSRCARRPRTRRRRSGRHGPNDRCGTSSR